MRKLVFITAVLAIVAVIVAVRAHRKVNGLWDLLTFKG
jgi:hypothetical protein